jgi:hypothetical protein
MSELKGNTRRGYFAGEILRRKSKMPVPQHQHDCDCCTFLGNAGTADLYFCPQGGIPTVIARYGEAGNYVSGLFAQNTNLDLLEAKRRAQLLGLLPKD